MMTISKLRMMMMAIVAIVCGMTLGSCGDDDDDNTEPTTPTEKPVAEENKLDSVEMRITYSVTQDLKDMYNGILIYASRQLSNKYEFNLVKCRVGTDVKTYRIVCNADRLPASVCARISTGTKILTEVKDSYNLGYDFNFVVIAYYKDGREEVVTTAPYNNEHSWYQYNTALYNPTLEEVKKEQGEIEWDLLMGYRSFITLAKKVEDGKEVVKVYNLDEKRVVNE